MLEALKNEVFEANMLLPKYGLVTFTWGNVSAIDREKGLIVIKPSGVEYVNMKPSDMVVVDLDGNIIDGTYKPSSDTPTHIELYKASTEIQGVVHTHSTWATSWAQSGRAITNYGTTQADYFFGDVPCVRALNNDEIAQNYEKNTGLAIVEHYKDLSFSQLPGALCKHHGVFAWGKNANDAVHNAVVIEEVAKMAALTEQLNKNVTSIPQSILDKHYYRKHGANAYYGQN